MDINEIDLLNQDISRIRKFYNKKEEHDASVDKFGRGFNKDNRFAAAGSHTVSFDSWKGYFGNSGSTSQLSIHCKLLFWECFDRYINDHQEEIMLAIADMMEAELKSKADNILKEMNRLKEIYDRVMNK